MNKLRIEVGDLVTWGGFHANFMVTEVLSNGFIASSNYEHLITIEFNTIGLKIVKKGKSIEEKYGIELINKEMWCWEDDQKNASLHYILCKRLDSKFPYPYIDLQRSTWRHASEENPNKEKEYKIADIFIDKKLTKKELKNIINNLQ